MEWRLIETVPDMGITDVILWNGHRVFTGWKADDGWHDSGNQDHADDPEDPQPTHWMSLPDPPVSK